MDKIIQRPSAYNATAAFQPLTTGTHQLVFINSWNMVSSIVPLKQKYPPLPLPNEAGKTLEESLWFS